jgi:hypothetical protein
MALSARIAHGSARLRRQDLGKLSRIPDGQ